LAKKNGSKLEKNDLTDKKNKNLAVEFDEAKEKPPLHYKTMKEKE
jgi:hypothetical protein